MTYQESLKYLASLGKMGIRFDLGPITRLLTRLNNPQEKYESILITGTNGKGSISAMISSILSKAGYKVGLYTSPHLVDLRERITMNGSMISREEMKECIAEVKYQIKEDISYFEFLTAAAFLYFSKKHIDVAVLEVGMGGRLDATNVVMPVASVISNVSLEHTEYLGNSLEKIAWEKGGIIKDGGLCITAAKQKKVIVTLERICKERNARFFHVGKDIKTIIRNNGTFSYQGIEKSYHRLICPLIGRHQIKNAAVAIGAIELMMERGFHIVERDVQAGIKNVKWAGRLEVLQKNPLVIMDGAHNPACITVLCRALKDFSPYKKLILVFGVLHDKDYKFMVKRLASFVDEFIITRPQTERGLPISDLLPIVKQYNRHAVAIEKPLDALRRAMTMAAAEDLVCVTGSLYLVGDIKQDLPKLMKLKQERS